MTKAELIEKIYSKAGLPTKALAEDALDAVIASLREALRTEYSDSTVIIIAQRVGIIVVKLAV